MARHAEIAGAGIAGLTAAAALAQRGWSVTVHERDPEIRAYGAGIFIYENGLRVLEAVGAAADATAGVDPPNRREARDRGNRAVSVSPLNRNPGDRVVTILRQRLLLALRDAATRAGAEIVTSSSAVGATPGGEIILADQRRRQADLVIAADGVHSRLRDGLGLLKLRRKLPEGGIRVIVPRHPEDFPEGSAVIEQWIGARRIVCVPCDREHVYIALGALIGDAEAISVPVRKSVWASDFPHFGSLLGRIGENARWDQFELLRLSRWSKGRVAILGDAAHAQPPNLGQGGGCSMMAALGLAVALDESREVEPALARWEQRERPIVEHTQRISMLYGRLTTWPPRLRNKALALMHRWPWLNRQRLKTARHVPTGTLPTGTFAPGRFIAQ